MSPVTAFTPVLNLQFTVVSSQGDFPGAGPDENGYAEFTIQSICSHLQDHIVQYEQKKF